MLLLNTIILLCTIRGVLLLQFLNITDSVKVDELQHNVSLIQSIAENAVNEVHRLQQELSQETALRVSLQQELDRFKQQNFSSVLSQLTTVADVLSEVHLLRQLLNQETSFRMSLENQLRQQNQLTNALSTNVTYLLNQLQMLSYDIARNDSVLENKIQQNRLFFQNGLTTTNHNVALLQNNMTSELQEVHQNQVNLQSTLQTVNMTVQQSLVNQSAINSLHTQELMELGYNITSLLHQVNNTNFSLSTEITALWHNISEIKQKQDKSGSTAFSVRLSKPMSTFPQEKTIKFDQVMYNDGKHYNPTTGVFTAPSAGVYSFYWSTLTVNGHFMSSVLTVNGSPTLGALSDGRGGSSYDSGSNLAILRLGVGDRVWVEQQAGGYIQSDFSSFSGFKIASTPT